MKALANSNRKRYKIYWCDKMEIAKLVKNSRRSPIHLFKWLTISLLSLVHGKSVQNIDQNFSQRDVNQSFHGHDNFELQQSFYRSLDSSLPCKIFKMRLAKPTTVIVPNFSRYCESFAWNCWFGIFILYLGKNFRLVHFYMLIGTGHTHLHPKSYTNWLEITYTSLINEAFY